MTAQFSWRLEELMHDRGIHRITELQRRLEPEGIKLSSSQMHRLVTQTPERLNLTVLAALCVILECEPGDLVVVQAAPARRAAVNGGNILDLSETGRPKRARVRRDDA